MGKYKRLLSNTAILGAGTFISKVLVFLLMPLYTALLSAEQFGTADILTQTANLIMPLAALGIGDGLFRFALDAGEERRKKVFTSALGVILLGIIPLAILINILHLFKIFDGYVWLVLLYVCTANLHLVCANYIRACDKTKAFAIQGIANTALTIIFNVLFLLVFDMGVLGYVLSVAISDLIITVCIFLGCKLYADISLQKAEKGLLPSMLKFSIPYIPITLMWMITSASDRFIVTAFRGAAENGLYAAAYKLPTLISLAGGVFIEAWQFSSVNDAKPEERSRFFGSVYRNYVGIMFMCGSGLVLASKLLTRLLLDDAYYSSWQYVSVLGIAMIFSSLSAFMGSVYFLEKRSLRSMITATVGAITNIVLNFILIPTYGAMGAAVATAISYAVAFIIRAVDTGRYLRFDLQIIRLIVNTALIIAQTVLMILELRYWIFIELAIFVFMAIFNGREIFNAAISVAKKFLVRKRKNI
ncbi:MAG: polysaccharide biosynthesis C-terminal domain-containing protein [Clostridia bacterium]|nr:polysaccharide biosynthesis C-terminal domain-containing protein [Clostridia bacterium]